MDKKLFLSKYFFLFVTLIIGTSYILIKSKMNLASLGGYDSAVFSTIGFSWTQGLIPYKDLFDHKGPLLYLLNALGFYIFNEFYGILIFEIIFFAINIFIFFSFCKDNKYSFFIAFIFSLFYLNTIFQEGNLTEEYAITFNLLACLFSTKKYSSRFYFYGLLGGLLCLLRPNTAAPTLIIFFIDLLSQHRKLLFLSIIKCALSFLFTILVPISYFLYHNALDDFIKCYILFNITYTSISKENFIFIELVHIIKNFYFYIPLFIMLFYISQKNKVLSLKLLCIFIFSMLFTAISGRNYPHYFMITIPSAYLIISNFITLYKTDETILTLINKYYLSSSISYKLKTFAHSRKSIFIFFLGGVLVFHYIFIIYQSITPTNLITIREFFYQHGISDKSSLLNLAEHHASKLFYILKIPPKEKDFFPKTASVTSKFSEIINKKHIPCPEDDYDLIIIPSGSELKCPSYSYFKTPLTTLTIYKRNDN